MRRAGGRGGGARRAARGGGAGLHRADAGHQTDAALADTLFEQCNARLAYFKAPGWVLFLDKLPTTGTQKVQKTQIFAPGEDPRQRAGIIDLRARKRRS